MRQRRVDRRVGWGRRENAALGHLRTLVSAQAAYASANGLLYGTPECLVKPTGPGCIPDYPTGAPVFVDASCVEARRGGFVYMFHPGPRPSAEKIRAANAGAGSLERFAYVAVPAVPGRSATRAFCTDESGAIRVSNDGTMPVIVDARCPESLELVR